MHVVTVTFAIDPACLERFLTLVRQQRLDSLARSSGCRTFDIAHDESHRVFLYEIYDRSDDFAHHLQTPHFRAFAAATAMMVTSKTVDEWRLDPRSETTSRLAP